MPPEVENDLKSFFFKTDRLQEMLSARWREHSNRRTIIILVCVGFLAIISYLFIIRPPDDFPLQHLVSVPEGASLKETANTLKKDNVVRSTLVFRLIVTLSGHEHSMQAGDYIFKEPLDIFHIARAISIGANGLEPLRIRVPEVATTKQMAIIFSGQLERFNMQRFLFLTQPMGR